MNIEQRIENLSKMKRRTLDAVQEIEQWWSKNVGVLGRKIGKWELQRLKYSNAYSGTYDDYIIANEGYDDEEILGYGYTGYHSGNDYNCFSVRCANRDSHIYFLKNFKNELEEHLAKIEEKEKELTGLNITLN